MKILRILILEHDALQRRFLQLYLEGSGFEVEYRENGLEGLKLLKTAKPFDLIMSDLNMPIMNGLEFLIEMKKHQRICDIPVVLLTRIDNKKIREKAQSLGAFFFMEKPFTNEKISYVINTLKQVT